MHIPPLHGFSLPPLTLFQKSAISRGQWCPAELRLLAVSISYLFIHVQGGNASAAFPSKMLGFLKCSSSLCWGTNLVLGCKASPPGCPLQLLPMEQGAAVMHKLLCQSALFTEETMCFWVLFFFFPLYLIFDGLPDT